MIKLFTRNIVSITLSCQRLGSMRHISSSVRSRLEVLLKENRPLEIIRVLKESSIEHQTRNISHGLNGESILEISGLFPTLFGEKRDDLDVLLVKDIVSCVDTLVPYSKYKTMVRLINYYCDRDDAITAVKYYDGLQESSLSIDALSFEKLVGKLCENAMVDEIERILRNQNPSIAMAERMIEPYILNGRVFEFSKHFSSILRSEETFFQLDNVKSFIEALLKARLRRAISGAPKTLSEMVGLEGIHKDLSRFNSTLEKMFYLKKLPTGYGRCVAIIFNYLEFCNEDWDEETILSPMLLAPDGRASVEIVPDQNIKPALKYIVEHRNFHGKGKFLEDSPFEVLDITAELGIDKLKPPLLYHADLFDSAQEDEQKFVSLICNEVLDLPLINIFDETLEELDLFETDEEVEYGDESGIRDDEFDDMDSVDEAEALDACSRDEEDRQRKVKSQSSLQNWDDEFDGEEQTEESSILAASNPRRRINDLSRSLFATFSRYQPSFKDPFFHELELLSYEDPKNANFLLSHELVSKVENLGDCGDVKQGTVVPVDAEVGK